MKTFFRGPSIISRFILLIVSLLLYILLSYIYKNEISPANLYLGFYFQANYWKLAISVIFFVLPVFFLPIVVTRPSDLAVWCLYLFSYAPTALMGIHISEGDLLHILLLFFVLFFSFLIIIFVRKVNINLRMTRKINWHGIDSQLFGLVFIFVLTYLVYLSQKFEFGFSFENIYERRFRAREIISRGDGYVMSIAQSVLTLASVYLFITKGEKKYLIISFTILILIFQIDGTKSAIVNLLFLLYVVYMVKRFNQIYFLPATCVLIALVGVAEWEVFDTAIISEYIVRRIFIVPGYLNTVYWDYFSIHDKALLSDSIGRYIVGDIYKVPVTYLIGSEYFNNPEINANTGIWMGGFAHFGIFGILLFSLIGGTIFSVIDNILKRKFFLLGVLVCTYIGFIWCEQMLHTSVLSGGVLYIALFLLFVVSSNNLSRRFSCYAIVKK